MKVTNYLLGYKDLKIVQDSDMFSFSLDSVLLPNFVTINKKISTYTVEIDESEYNEIKYDSHT